jgi:glycosyltransferase involved in cell wall biosynthesis
VSVIIPCFNAEAYICETLASVVAQEREDLEIVVVDDGSTDQTAPIVEREFPSVRLIRSDNSGASAARNLGTSLARGAFLQYLDADDLLAAGKIERQLRTLADSGAHVAYGDWRRLVTGPGGGYIEGEVISRTLANTEIDLFTDFWCPPAAYLFRRSIVDRTGGWNLGLPIIQDARFALDCALHGGTFVRCEGLMAYYRVHRSGSVSTRDPAGFARDCLHNAADVERWWELHGGISHERRRALVSVYGYVARASFERDRPTFDAAFSRLHRLAPGYVPSGPAHLRLASRAVGYRRAEQLALWYRRLKHAVRLLSAEAPSP